MAALHSINASNLLPRNQHLSLEQKFEAILQLSNFIIDISEFSLDFTVEEAKLILSSNGNQIKRLRYSSTFNNDAINEYVELFAIYCKNLEEIQMKWCEITIDSVYSRLLVASRNVQRLILNNCTLENAICASISHLKDLETLDLEDSNLTGDGLDTLTKLIDLNLNKCGNFKSENFIGICKRNSLRKLNILNYYNVTEEAASILLRTQRNLEIFILDCYHTHQKYQDFFGIESLREVSVHSSSWKDFDECLKALSEVHSETLEALELKTEQFIHTDEEYLTFRNLRALSLNFCNFFFGNNYSKLEMLQIRHDAVSNTKLPDYVKCLRNLRYLDICPCYVDKNLYYDLVETRKNQGFYQQLIVFCKLKMEWTEMLKFEYYVCNQHYVKLVTELMRHYNDFSMLDRLDYLNAKYATKTEPTNPLQTCNINSLLPPKSCLLDLNDDCLRQIIKHLGEMEKLKLLLTSDRFDAIINDFLSSDFVDLHELSQQITIREAQELFPRYGHMLRKIRMHSFREACIQYVSLAVNNCNCVESIMISNIRSPKCTELIAEKLLSAGEKLKEIEIRKCKFTYIMLQKVSKLSTVEKLVLEALSLSIDPKQLHNVFKSNQLSELNLSYAQLDENTLRTLVVTQRKLQTLTLANVPERANMLVLAKLESLINLSLIECSPEGTAELLTALSNTRGKHLKSLTLIVQKREVIYVPEFLGCISKCPNLVYLELGGSVQIDNGFIEYIIKYCSQLEILYIRYKHAVNDYGIVRAVENLPELRHLDIKITEFHRAEALYWRFCDIKSTQNVATPLTFHVHIDYFDHMIQTMDYIVKKKYVVITDRLVRDMTKAELLHKPTQNKNGLQHILPEKACLDLPDKCIRKIASNLESIDILKFASTSERILEAIKPIASTIVFDINEISCAFTLDEANKLFNAFRDYIHRFKYTKSRDTYPKEYLKLIEPFSGSFREISITEHWFYTTDYEVEKLFGSPYQKLELLSISSGGEQQVCVPIMKKMAEKQSLGLNPLQHITELRLNDFRRYWKSVNQSVFDGFFNCFHNSKLKRIDMRGNSNNLVNHFTFLLEKQCSYLEWLGIDWVHVSDSFPNVARLFNLKYISIDLEQYDPAFEVFLYKLLKYRRNDLLSIEITMRRSSWNEISKVSYILEEKRSKFVNLKNLKINW